jgi:hypothetical protein
MEISEMSISDIEEEIEMLRKKKTGQRTPEEQSRLVDLGFELEKRQGNISEGEEGEDLNLDEEELHDAEEDLAGDQDELAEGQETDETDAKWEKRKAKLEKNITSFQKKIAKLKAKLGQS